MAKRGNGFLLGLVLLAVGVGLVVWGYSEAGSIGGKLNRAFAGSPTDRVMMLYIGGAVCGVLGLGLTFRNR
jgi:hypothetical protein